MERSLIVLAGFICLSFPDTFVTGVAHGEETREFWMTEGHQELQKARQKPNIGVAKNVILFLGDGMGVSTVTAARILKGQLAGRSGEEGSLSFDNFPSVGLSKTYNIDAQTADSAGTATAYLSGVKSNYGVLGVDGRSRLGDCSSLPGTELETMLDWAQAKGKSVGVVTTARITHATPGALYAKTPHRDWESDTDMTSRNVTGPCTDIAQQLVDNNLDLKVILGGGRTKFLRNTDRDPETGQTNAKARTDGRNLIEDWERKQGNLGRSYRYVWNASAFNGVDPYNTDYLLGLFGDNHMQYALDRASDVGGEPTLVEMTNKAIRMLARNENGFFLLVEGGRIDHGHHDSLAKKALHETIELSDAVEEAMKLTSDRDTLIMVTADHSHVFNIAGYPSRGLPILGLADDQKGGSKTALDGKPYTTLQYSNGPGGYATDTGAPRPDPGLSDTQHKDYKQQSGVPLSSETHGGEDVAIYARGPMSHLIHGVHEQSYIAHVMAYASCVGSYSEASSCAMADVQDQHTSDGDVVRVTTWTLIMSFICTFYCNK